jgi:hypothetical protein
MRATSSILVGLAIAASSVDALRVAPAGVARAARLHRLGAPRCHAAAPVAAASVPLAQPSLRRPRAPSPRMQELPFWENGEPDGPRVCAASVPCVCLACA